MGEDATADQPNCPSAEYGKHPVNGFGCESGPEVVERTQDQVRVAEFRHSDVIPEFESVRRAEELSGVWSWDDFEDGLGPSSEVGVACPIRVHRSAGDAFHGKPVLRKCRQPGHGTDLRLGLVGAQCHSSMIRTAITDSSPVDYSPVDYTSGIPLL